MPHEPIETTLLSDRKHLSARKSIESIIRYAQQSDNRLIARMKRSSRSSALLTTLIYGGVGVSTFWVVDLIDTVLHLRRMAGPSSTRPLQLHRAVGSTDAHHLHSGDLLETEGRSRTPSPSGPHQEQPEALVVITHQRIKSNSIKPRFLNK